MRYWISLLVIGTLSFSRVAISKKLSDGVFVRIASAIIYIETRKLAFKKVTSYCGEADPEIKDEAVSAYQKWLFRNESALRFIVNAKKIFFDENPTLKEPFFSRYNFFTDGALKKYRAFSDRERLEQCRWLINSFLSGTHDVKVTEPLVYKFLSENYGK